MPVSRRVLLGSAGIMGLSTVAAACDQNGRSVANAAGIQEIVSADSAAAGPAPVQEEEVETKSQNRIEIDQFDEGAAHSAPDTVFSLRTGISGSRLVIIGDGGAIDGEINADLTVNSGDLVEVTLVNGDGAEHDFVIDEFDARTDRALGLEASSSV